MNPSNDLIRAIVDEDFVTAKELTNNLIFTAVSDVLDGAKREVAADLFSDCEECGSMDEATRAEKDYDEDGVRESPNAEVKGSHINAAVAGGRLTPRQAARTKNKGMYR